MEDTVQDCIISVLAGLDPYLQSPECTDIEKI